MSEPLPGTARRVWLQRARGAAVGFGLGATLALSPLVWAQNAPAGDASAPTQTSPVMPQQSFAPLVKRVQPAVVNISVTEAGTPSAFPDQSPDSFRGAPFDDL